MKVAVSPQALMNIQTRLAGVETYKDEFSSLVRKLEEHPESGRLLARSHSGATYALDGTNLRILYNVSPAKADRDAVAIILNVLAKQDFISTNSPLVVHIFECSSKRSVFGATLEADGGNLPQNSCEGGSWQLFKIIEVSENDPPRIGLDTKAMLKCLREGAPYLFSSKVGVS